MAVLPAKVGLGKVSPGTKETRVSQKTTPQKEVKQEAPQIKQEI